MTCNVPFVFKLFRRGNYTPAYDLPLIRLYPYAESGDSGSEDEAEAEPVSGEAPDEPVAPTAADEPALEPAPESVTDEPRENDR